jgi:hypothetical protein
MAETRDRPAHPVADILYDTIYIAGLGGGIVAVFFVFYDIAVHGDFFFTPSLMGRVLFDGIPAQAVQGVSMEAVAKFTPVHMAAFTLFGLALSWFTQQVEIRSRNPALLIVGLFVVLELAFWIGTSIFIPGVLDRIGVVPVAIANLLAAAGIGLFLRSSHRRDLTVRIRGIAQPGSAPRA